MKLSSFHHIYLCTNIAKHPLKVNSSVRFAGHLILDYGRKKLICPEKFTENKISPKYFKRLKDKLNINNILLIDRLEPSAKLASIVGHVNRSGCSFLRGRTPYKNFPQFSDMSHIYSQVSMLPTTVVHALGPERFIKQPKGGGLVWGEASGIIAVVAHYVGIRVFAVGAESIQVIKKTLKEIIDSK